jgi:hypothetical protein
MAHIACKRLGHLTATGIADTDEKKAHERAIIA